MERYCPSCDRSYDGDQASCPTDGTALVSVGADPLVGRRLASYTIGERLGAGGMGAVYRAWQHSVGRDVAIKIVHPHAGDRVEAAKRFLREAKLASRLVQPNVVVVHDFGQTDDGILFIAMELVRGKTLAAVLDADGPFSPARVIRVGTQICDALEAAHALSIVHRDLKPANLMILDEPPGRDLVKVLDFGLAKSLGDADPSTVTQSGAVMGTPRYMSPEAVRGTATDARSDLYALGVILAELAAGFAPFEGRTARETMELHLQGEPRLGALPRPLENVIRRLISLEPGDRHASAATARDALLAADDALRSAPPASRDPEALAATLTSASPAAPARAPIGRFAVVAGAIVASYAACAVATGYAGPDPSNPTTWIQLGGGQIWGVITFFALGIVAAVGSGWRRASGMPMWPPAWWLVLAPSIAAIGGVLGSLIKASAGAREGAPLQAFALFSQGSFEANAVRFVGFWATAALGLLVGAAHGAGGGRAPPSKLVLAGLVVALGMAALGAGLDLSIVSGAGIAVAIALAVALAMPSAEPGGRVALAIGVWIVVAAGGYARLIGEQTAVWHVEATRAERAAMVVAAAERYRVTTPLLAGLALMALVALLWRLPVARLPRTVWGVLALLVVATAFDIGMHAWSEGERRALRAQLASQLELFASLVPPATDRLDARRFRPHAAPALQVGRDRIAIDGVGVAPIGALRSDEGALNLGRDISHAMGARPPSEPDAPDLSLSLDRTLAWSDVTRVLEIIRRSGGRRVEILLTRGAAPVLPPDAPPEASYVRSSDFVALRVEIAGSGFTAEGTRHFDEVVPELIELALAGGSPIRF